MVADPTVLQCVLIAMIVAVILAVVVGRRDDAPLALAVLGSVTLGLLVLADSVILLYYVTPQSNDKLLLFPALLVLLPGLVALFAAFLTLIGILASLMWCLGRRRFGGLGFPLLLAALAVELVGIVLFTSVEAGARFLPPLGNSTFEALALACMTLAGLAHCVGEFVLLHTLRTRRPAGFIAPSAR